MALPSTTPKGFAGLSDMASDLDVWEAPKQAPVPSPPARPTVDATTQPRVPDPLKGTVAIVGEPHDALNSKNLKPELAQKGQKPLGKPSNGMSGAFIAVGLFAFIGILVAIVQNSGSANKSAVPLPTTPMQELASQTPSKPSPPVVKTYYKLRGSDGSEMEVDGPANASPAQLNEIGQKYWHPPSFQPEEIPPAGDGLEFGANQIRYCLSQKIRMNGWNKTVDSYNHESVAAFNSAVADFNARCSHYKYRGGVLERVQGEVAQLTARLEADGKAHRGPRSESPSKPPTYKKISSRTVTFGGVQSHPQCAGSSELAKCEALASKMDAESEQQRKARQTRLESDRARAMAEVAK